MVKNICDLSLNLKLPWTHQLHTSLLVHTLVWSANWVVTAEVHQHGALNQGSILMMYACKYIHMWWSCFEMLIMLCRFLGGYLSFICYKDSTILKIGAVLSRLAELQESYTWSWTVGQLTNLDGVWKWGYCMSKRGLQWLHSWSSYIWSQTVMWKDL